MKKIILSLILVATLSCSKDDAPADYTIEVTESSILGRHNISKIIRPDGTIEPYPYYCGMQRDHLYFYPTKINLYTYTTSCQNYEGYVCNDYTLVGNRITHCNGVFDGRITEFTSKMMRIDYDNVYSMGNHANFVGDVKGLILIRE